MNSVQPRRSAALAWSLALCAPSMLWIPPVQAQDVAAACQDRKLVADESTPLPQLLQRITAMGDTDPMQAFDLLCGTWPRVVREQGLQSLQAARWTQAMATPLIAYLNRFDVAESLLAHARPILQRRLGARSAEVAEIHVADAWMNLRRGRVNESGDAWERALDIRETVPGDRQIELQKVLVGLAQIRMAQRRFAEAKSLTARGFDILRENGETISEAAGALKNLQANIALASEDFLAARDYAREQVAIELELRSRGGPDQPVTAYAMLGQALQRLNEYAEAEAALRESVRWSESAQGPLQRGALTAYTQLSALLNDRGRPEQAAEFAQRALARGEQELGPDVPMLVPVIYNLARAQQTLGDLAAALRLYQRAATIIERNAATAQRLFVMRHHRGYAALLLQLGDRESAVREIARAADLSREDATLKTEYAEAVLLLGIAQRSADLQQAQSRIEEAVAIYIERLGETHPRTLRALNELCSLEMQRDARAPACTLAGEKLTAARFADPQIRQAVLQNLSERAGLQGDSDAMRRLALESLAAAQTLPAPDSLWRAEFQLARSLQSSGESALAIFFGKQAVDELQKLRRSLRNTDLRLDSTFLRDKVAIYRTLANWLMDLDRLDEALEVLDLMKSEELAEFLRGGGEDEALSRNEAELALARRYQSLLSGNDALGVEMVELARLQNLDRISAAERSKLEAFLLLQRQVEAQRAERMDSFLRGDAAAKASRAVQERTVRAARLDRELRQFGRRTALAIYVLDEERLRILIATPDRQLEHQVAISGSGLRRDIGLLLDGVAAKHDVSERSRRLYEQLMAPVVVAARAAGVRRLVLWPDGPLRYVPFALLQDGTGHLSDHFELQLYSDQSRQSHRGRDSKSALAVRGLGVTQALGGFAALPSVAEEMCAIVRGPIEGLNGTPDGCSPATGEAGGLMGLGAVQGFGYADSRFTPEQFVALMASPRDFSVLHISTHFSLRPGNALRSYLLAGNGARMTLDQLAAIDFGGVQLITLSACQTALGGAVTDDGREIESLSTLVQRRGVARVLASLWPVEDRSTAILMKSFYRRLAESPGQGARALRLAQLDLQRYTIDGRQPYQHPFYWAGFTLDSAIP